MLVYIDESGYPHPNDFCTKSVLLAVCIREMDIREITARFYTLKDRIFGKQCEIKSTNLINAKTITKNRTKNKMYTDSVMDILDSCSCNIFAIIMNRPDFVPYTDTGMLPVQYHRLLQRIQYHCNKHRTLMAMCVFDQTDDGRDQKYAQGFNNFLFRSKEGQSFDKILVSPFFVSSTVTSTIELPDICAGIVRNYYQLDLNKRAPNDAYEEWLALLFQRIIVKSEDFTTDNGVMHGFYQMPTTAFRKKAE